MLNLDININLQGEQVFLRPICLQDAAGLVEAVSDGQLDKLWYTQVPCSQSIDDYLNEALNQQAMRQSQVFTVVSRNSGEILGSTRFCNIDANHDRLEIGYTWYRKSVQRTAVNTETKYLLLKYAFETLNVIAVEFRTHWMNHASRNAILRLGAKQDGVLRNHRKMPDGSLRDTVVFSITSQEWLAVKAHLEFKLS